MILIHDLLRDAAERHPERVFLTADGREHRFAEVAEASRRIASALQGRGLVRGDRVVLMMENSAEAVVSFFGVLAAGCVAVPINPTTKADKLAYVLQDSGARAVVSPVRLSPSVLPALEQCPGVEAALWIGSVPPSAGGAARHVAYEALVAEDAAPRDPGLIDEDLCAIIYTSGSTGFPKGVMLTHRNMSNTAWSISTYLGNRPDDRVLCVLPLSFDYGLYQVVTGARIGFEVVLERSFAYPFRVAQILSERRVTGLPGVPTLFASLLQFAPFDGLDLSSLRYLTNTAAALPPSHIGRLRELFPQARIFSMYGLTECTRVCFLDPARLDDKVGSVGKAIPNSEVYLVDDAGRRLGPGSTGELVIRGANVMRGYWNKPEATAERLRDGPIPGEKALYSGDLFHMDEEGFLYFLGRKDDIFKCRGEKVSPKEVEQVLYELPEIAEAAVVGIEHPIDGQAVKVFLVLAAGATLTERAVRDFCRARLESHLVPRFVEFRSTLPKTDTGKIRRKSLLEPMG